MELAANELKKILKSDGVRNVGEHITAKSVIVSLIPLLVLVEAILSMAYRWNDLGRRFLALEDANIWFTILVLTYGIVYGSQNMNVILQVLTEPYSIYGIENSPRKLSVIKLGVQSTEAKIKYMSVLVNLIRFNFFAIPLFQTVYTLFSNAENSIFNLYLPYEFYHVHLVENLYLFFAINACQIGCSFIFANGSKSVFLSFMPPIQRVILDIRLLCISIEELDQFVYRESMSDEVKLRYYMSKLIAHHSDICNRIHLINKAIPLFAFFGLQSCCSQICLQFYWIAEVDDTVLWQTKDLIQVLAVGGYLYFYSSVGQHILNEGKLLRNTINQCSWLEKPLWFKRSLSVMITAANKPFQIQPYGLYVISFNSFTSMIKAAYSCFNLLRTFKK